MIDKNEPKKNRDKITIEDIFGMVDGHETDAVDIKKKLQEEKILPY